MPKTSSAEDVVKLGFGLSGNQDKLDQCWRSLTRFFSLNSQYEVGEPMRVMLLTFMLNNKL